MGEDPNRRGVSRRWIIQEVENSLRRLGTDWIDLYQIHRYDPETDIEETLGALSDLVAPGQGPLHRLLDLPAIDDRRGAVGGPRPAACSASSPSSRRTRSWSAGSRPTCCRHALRHGMGVIPWSPLAGGWLSGRWRKGAETPVPASARAERLARALRPLAARQPAQARRGRAARAARRRGGDHRSSSSRSRSSSTTPPITAAIIGPRTMEHLESQLAAADVVLDEARAGPHRRDRPARHEHQSRRRRVAEPGPGGGGAAAVGRRRRGRTATMRSWRAP